MEAVRLTIHCGSRPIILSTEQHPTNSIYIRPPTPFSGGQGSLFPLKRGVKVLRAAHFHVSLFPSPHCCQRGPELCPCLSEVPGCMDRTLYQGYADQHGSVTMVPSLFLTAPIYISSSSHGKKPHTRLGSTHLTHTQEGPTSRGQLCQDILCENPGLISSNTVSN